MNKKLWLSINTESGYEKVELNYGKKGTERQLPNSVKVELTKSEQKEAQKIIDSRKGNLLKIPVGNILNSPKNFSKAVSKLNSKKK